MESVVARESVLSLNSESFETEPIGLPSRPLTRKRRFKLDEDHVHGRVTDVFRGVS